MTVLEQLTRNSTNLMGPVNYDQINSLIALRELELIGEQTRPNITLESWEKGNLEKLVFYHTP